MFECLPFEFHLDFIGVGIMRDMHLTYVVFVGIMVCVWDRDDGVFVLDNGGD